MKHTRRTTEYSRRVVTLLLCVSVLFGVFPALPAAAVDAPTLCIEYAGEETQGFSLPRTEKAALSAVCGAAVSYQWQILADIESGLWVDIYDGTQRTLNVSNALLAPVLDAAGSAYVRAKVETAEQTLVSEPVCVTVTEPEMPGTTAPLTVQTRRPALTSESDLITIHINYLDAVSGNAIYTNYSAQIDKGTTLSQSVTSPTYIGYRPYYDPTDPATDDPAQCTIAADVIQIDIPADYAADDYTVNVYYKATVVTYAVRYFFQNIGDDFYTEDSGLYRLGTAETGTVIADVDLSVDVEGFTKLYHYPETIAGDGSTVFECYYDRNYSMLKFNLGGGYGTDPIYARYGTHILVNEPKRAGYEFRGWQLMDAEGNYGETLVELPATVPNDSRTYRAVWQMVDSSYTIAYWLQNANDDNYTYIGAETRTAQSAAYVEAGDYLRADTLLCGQGEVSLAHEHTGNCYPQGFKHLVYDGEKTEAVNERIIVAGDGSSHINIYYTRKYYTLRFIYAREYDPDYNVGNPGAYPEAAGYAIPGGSTYGFGNKNSQSSCWPNGVGSDYDLTELMRGVKKWHAEIWGTIDALPELNTDRYETGVYPAPGEGYNGSDYDYDGDRYYYFDLTARYGTDLTELWPSDVFKQIEVPYHAAQAAGAWGEGEWGHYAYFAGWNGEFKVNYSLQKTNSTVKGFYQKLDDGLLFGNAYSYESDTKIDRVITTKATDSGEEVTSYLNYYLGFYDNGASVAWSIPREWNYHYYLPILDGMLTDAQKTQLKDAGEPMELNGTTYYYYALNDEYYYLYKIVVTNDNAQAASDQTQCMLTGFDFAAGSGMTDSCPRAEKIKNPNLPDKRMSFTLRMFYKRHEFTLGLYNYNDYYDVVSAVPYEAVLDRYLLDDSGAIRVPDQPEGLEPNAYVFGGWYTSQQWIDGTEYKPGDTMPANNRELYAKWTPNVYTVNFFQTYDDMLAFEAGDTSVVPLKTRSVQHGNVVGSVENPTRAQYEFSGWFYMKYAEKAAFTPLDFPVKSDLNLFAEWNSNSAQPYLIQYALKDAETDAAWNTALNRVAGSAPRRNYAYSATVDGETRTYVALEDGYHLQIAAPSAGYAYQGNTRTFLPKSGVPQQQLYDDYNAGYYPTSSGHSITIAYEEDKDSLTHNIFTFTYVYLGSVDYRVEYRDRITNALLTDKGVGDGGSGIAHKTTAMGVVTERFAPIADYIPDAFYKKLILAVEQDEHGNYVGSKNNVITFYYTTNSESTFYAVHYMFQNVDGSGYTEGASVTEGIAKIGSSIALDPAARSGFTMKDTAVLKSGGTETELTYATASGGFRFTVDADGSELYVYYDRNPQTYAVYYLLDGTDVSDLSAIPAENILAETVTGSGVFGATVTAAPKTIEHYNCITEGAQSITLRSNDRENYIVFFYTPWLYNVQYRAWSLGGGTFDVTSETKTGSFTGSAPTADEGYTFGGWYLDAACTQPVGALHTVEAGTNRLVPNADNLALQPKTNVFYAKFVTALGNLTVTRTNTADEGSGTQNFVYRITSATAPDFVIFLTLHGNDSVTVSDLPVGTYTVEQLGDWSWRYSDAAQTVTVTEEQTATATFGSAATNAKWLNGSSEPIKNRKGEE